MKQQKISLVIGFILLILSMGATADPTPADAKQLIEDTTNEVLSALTAQKDQLKANPKSVYPIIDKLVLPRFDFARMSKFVLGTHWKTATPDQQKRFTQAFRDLLVRTYSSALVEAAGTGFKVNYLPLQRETSADFVTLRTEVTQGKQKPIIVEYAMYVPTAEWRQEWAIPSEGWKVFNVTVEGVSLVTNYRTEFSNDIQKIGMDQLIEKIKVKQAQ